MAGLDGFFSHGFPMLEKFLKVFKILFKEFLPDLYRHFKNEGIPDLLWIHKWFQSCFLYSFPLGLCIRIWDNIWASGTKFLFQAAIAILKLIKNDLIELSFGDINERFKKLKDDDDRQVGSWTQQKLLPDFERIITEARSIKITDERIKALFQTFDQAKALQNQAPQQSISVKSKPNNISIDERGG